MNRRSFLGSLVGSALFAVASGTALAQTSLALAKGGRSRSVLVRIEGIEEWVWRWATWTEQGHLTWHEVPVGEPGVDAPYLDDFL